MALSLSAQVASTPTPALPAKEDEDLVVLSPFTVTAEEDTGYTANSTLSGSRLKTDLKDVAASVSVLTDDFMSDLGATDYASALSFVVGAENDATTDFTALNNLSQGFNGADFGDPNTRNNNVRVRGFGSATQTVNFIEQYTNADSYNSSRGEFLRGANSILFGLGNPAGIINQTTKTANLRRDAYSFTNKVDDVGSSRNVLDIGKVLIKNKLGLRVIGLYSDKRYDVDTAYWLDQRLFFTTTYKPFKNTKIEAFAELYDASGRRPNNRLVQDNVSAWLAAYNAYSPRMTPAQVASVFYWNPLAQTGAPGETNNITLTDGSVVSLGRLRRQMDGNANGTAVFYDGTDWDSPIGGTLTLFSNRTVTGSTGNRFFIRSGSPGENTTGYTDPQATNTAIFPWESVDLTTLPGSFRWEKNKKFNISIEQRLAQDLYLVATAQREKMEIDQTFSPIAQTQSINIDVTQNLPDGRPNPNFLRPFIYGRNIGNHAENIRTTAQVQASYEFDFDKKTEKLKWLGQHRLSTIYTRSKEDEHAYRFNWQIDNDLPGIMPTTQTNAGRQVYQVWYVGDPVQVGDTAIRYTGLPERTDAVFGAQMPYRYYRNTPTPAIWTDAPTPVNITRRTIANGRQVTNANNSGLGAALQSFFWKNRIVTLYGIRQDEVDFYNYLLDTAAEPLLGASRDDYTKPADPNYSNSVRTSTKSVVFHVTPWLRLFGTQSENFSATAPRTDNLWRPIKPQNGTTEELGVGLSLLKGKLDVRITHFNGALGNTTDTATFNIASLRVEGIEDNIYNALASAGRLSEWHTIGSDGLRTTTEYAKPNNIGSTSSVVSKGIEVEMIYNPTKNWRIAFNVSETDTKQSDVGIELSDFLAARAEFYRPYWQEGLRVDGTNDSLPNNNATRISTTFLNQIASPLVSAIALQGTANRGSAKRNWRMVTSYTFREGWFKGVSIGANARWEEKKVFGYASQPATFTVGGLENVTGTIADPSQPLYHKNPISGGAFASYTRKIWNNRVRWKVQLNAQNLLGDQGLRVIGLNPDSSPVWGIAPPRRYELTNTFSF